MTVPYSNPQTKIDTYLAELGARLYALPTEQAQDIVEEIRSHILDSASANGALTETEVDEMLGRLGPPSTLAAGYVADNFLARAERKRMAWTVFHAVLHWAALSLKGMVVLFACSIGYLFGASFLVAALIKPFNPEVGLWRTDADTFSLALGVAHAVPPGHELLGWKLIPLGLALGGGTILLTTHLALWCIRQFRRSTETRELRRAVL